MRRSGIKFAKKDNNNNNNNNKIGRGTYYGENENNFCLIIISIDKKPQAIFDVILVALERVVYLPKEFLWLETGNCPINTATNSSIDSYCRASK